MISTPNQNTTTLIPPACTATTVQTLLTSSFETLDVELDRLHNAIQHAEGLNPLLAARTAIALDNFAGEARRLADLMMRSPRPPYRNGTNKPFCHPLAR